jgi:hypothetical protein
VIELDLCQTLRSPERDMSTTRKRAQRISQSSAGEFPFEVRQVLEHSELTEPSEHSEFSDCKPFFLNHFLLICYYLFLLSGVLADKGLA